jgi:hypothetical protein
MGSTEPIFSDDFRTHVCPTDIVDPHQTPSLFVWMNPSRHNHYDNFEYIRQPLNPHDPLLAKAGPSNQTIDRRIEHVIDTAVTSAQVHLNAGVITFIIVGVQICSIYILHSFKCQSEIRNQKSCYTICVENM